MTRIEELLSEPGYEKYDSTTGKELHPLIQQIAAASTKLSLAMNALDDATYLGDPDFLLHALSVATLAAAELHRELARAKRGGACEEEPALARGE